MSRRLILFDIDETLINPSGVGRRAISNALAMLFNVPPEATRVSMAGKTDPQILYEILTNAGMTESECEARVPELIELYLKTLECELENANGYKLHAGVNELLAELDSHAEGRLGLLTGNVERGARMKLSKFDLNRYFPMGAFGSDSRDRMALPAIAHERAIRHYGENYQPHELVIIGDAENDILCAKGFGARSLAVGTGRTSKEQLLALSPDFLFDSLQDTKAILEAIFV